MANFYSFTQIHLYAWLIVIGLPLGLLPIVSASRRRKKILVKSPLRSKAYQVGGLG